MGPAAFLQNARSGAQHLSKISSRFWRGGRAVECGGLENRYPARDLGFESLPLRISTFSANLLTRKGRDLRNFREEIGVLVRHRPNKYSVNSNSVDTKLKFFFAKTKLLKSENRKSRFECRKRTRYDFQTCLTEHFQA